MFEAYTGEDTADEWGLAAGIFIAHYRHRHGAGPTFRELFTHLSPDTRGLPSALPADWDVNERRRAVSGFRIHAAIEWRRRGYIGYDVQVTRSLRVGPRFRERSRTLTRRPTPPHPDPPDLNPSPSTSAPGTLALPAPTAFSAYPTNPMTAPSLGDPFKAGTGEHTLPGLVLVAPALPADWSPAQIAAFLRTPRADLTDAGRRRSPAQWLLSRRDPSAIVAILADLKAS